MIEMPFVGHDYLTAKEYKDIRAKYRAARTTRPWDSWARWYLSNAGARDRAAVRRVEEYEAQTKAHNWAQIEALAAAEADVYARQQEITELTQVANQRDEENFSYTPAAIKAQRQLAAMGVPPRSRTSR